MEKYKASEQPMEIGIEQKLNEAIDSKENGSNLFKDTSTREN